MLFLKRLNDEFDEEREARKKEFLEDGLEEDEIEELLEDASIYETFFVPEQARWSKLKDLTLNIGPELDKAFKAIEDEKIGRYCCSRGWGFSVGLLKKCMMRSFSTRTILKRLLLPV